MNQYRNNILQILSRDGYSENQMKELLSNASCELSDKGFERSFDDFIFAVNRHVLNRMDDLDFTLNDPSTFLEKDLFCPIGIWSKAFSSKNHACFERIEIEKYPTLSKFKIEIKEFSEFSLPRPVQVFNRLGLSSAFELGFNGRRDLILGVINDWDLCASKNEVFLSKNNENWIFMDKYNVFFAVDSEIYAIRQIDLHNISNKVDVDIYKVEITESERKILSDSKNGIAIVEKGIETSISWLGSLIIKIDEDAPIFSKVRAYKKFNKKREFIGCFINNTSLNYQKYLYPVAISEDNETFISSVGYVDDKPAYVNMGILFGGKDSIEQSEDFTDKIPYALEELTSRIYNQTGRKEFVISPEKIKVKFGNVRSEFMPSGLGREVCNGDDREYIYDVVFDELKIPLELDERKFDSTRLMSVTSEDKFKVLLDMIPNAIADFDE